jgi:hypothetical protein
MIMLKTHTAIGSRLLRGLIIELRQLHELLRWLELSNLRKIFQTKY